jgi:hypothetical protein
MRKIYNFGKNRFLNFSSFLTSFLIISLSHNVTCKGPNDFEPPFDSLHPPPAPPQLINPVSDTAIRYLTPFPNDVVLKWNQVTEAESYQLQIVNDTSKFFGATIIAVEGTSTVYTLPHQDFYYWRVRAYCRKWTWYTNWSKPWRFYAYYVWY